MNIENELESEKHWSENGGHKYLFIQIVWHE